MCPVPTPSDTSCHAVRARIAHDTQRVLDSRALAFHAHCISVQAGFRFLFAAVNQGLWNADAHQLRPLDAQEGFEALAFASMLTRPLDGAQVRTLGTSGS